MHPTSGQHDMHPRAASQSIFARHYQDKARITLLLWRKTHGPTTSFRQLRCIPRVLLMCALSVLRGTRYTLFTPRAYRSATTPFHEPKVGKTCSPPTRLAAIYLVLGHHQHVSGSKEKTWGVISSTSANCSLTFLFFPPPAPYWKRKCQPYVCTGSSTLLPEHAASWKMALNDLLNWGTSTRADTITAREGGQRFRGCAAP